MTVSQMPKSTGALSVDMRLVRMAGRKDLALLILTWAAPVPTILRGFDRSTLRATAVVQRLRELGPMLQDFALAQEISGLMVVARSETDDVLRVELSGTASLSEDLATLLRPCGTINTVVIDGVEGPDVEALAKLADRVIFSSRQPTLTSVDGQRWETYGTAIIDALIEQERARSEPVLDTPGRSRPALNV